MAGKQFKLSIVVDATTASATKGLGGLGKTLGKLGLAAAGVGTAIVGGLAVAGGAVAKLAIDAAPLEGIKAAFEGITEASGKSSTAMLAALQKGSAGMITQRDLMMKYNLAAQLVGDQFANKLPDAMGFLGKIAAATGEDMGFMMDSLVRGVGRLSPMILDNLGIQVDLTAAYEAFAPTIGKTVDELSKQEQQAALMNQVMEKLAQNTANMPSIAGTAATSIAQLRTRFADFKDTLGKHALPVLGKVLRLLVKAADKFMPKLAAAFKVAMTVVEGFMDDVLPVFLERLRVVWNWITGVGIPKLKELALTLINFLFPTFNFFREKILPGLLQIATTVWDWFTRTAIPTLINLGKYLLAVVQDGDFLNDWLTHLPQPIQAAAEWIGQLITKLREWGAAMWEKLGPIIMRFVNEVLPALWKRAKELWGWIVATAIPKLKEWGAAIWEKVAPYVEKLAGLLGVFLGKAREAWGWIVTTAIPQLKEWGTALKTEVMELFERFTSEILPVWQTKFEEVWTAAKAKWDAFWEGFKPELDKMYEDLMDFVEVIKPELDRAWASLQVLWDEVKITADLLGEAFSLLTGMIFGTETQFGELVGALLKFGLDILLGNIVLVVEGLNVVLAGAIMLMKEFQGQAEALVSFLADPTLANLLGGGTAGLGTPYPGIPLGLPGFQFGGTMPGPRGQAGLAVLHGGETVTPAGRGGGVNLTGEAIQLLRTIAGKENVIVVETSDGGATRDHILTLGDRAWALPAGA